MSFRIKFTVYLIFISFQLHKVYGENTFLNYMVDVDSRIIQIESFTTSHIFHLGSGAGSVPWIENENAGVCLRLYPKRTIIKKFKAKKLGEVWAAVPLDNKRIILNFRGEGYHVAVWDIRNDRFTEYKNMGSWNYAEVSAVSPDEKYIISENGNKLILHDFKNNYITTELSSQTCRSPRFSPGGQYCAYLEEISRSPNMNLVIQKMDDLSKVIVELKGNIEEGRVVWSPSGRYVATIYRNVNNRNEMGIWGIDGQPYGQHKEIPFLDRHIPVWVGNPSRILMSNFTMAGWRRNKTIYKCNEMAVEIE